MRTLLSVNINKFATLRNSRGGNNPDVLKAATDALQYGADGITVHPRPDERHIRYQDVRDIKEAIRAELNIEGNCSEPRFVKLVLEVRPAQVTLVPDALEQITSNHGWDTIQHQAYLKEMISEFKQAGIRTSIFVDPDLKMVSGAAQAGADRIELYTESYAIQYAANRDKAVQPFVEAASLATSLGLGVNAGHDLDLNNLAFLKTAVPGLHEVSIGHALVCDALYLGYENAIRMYQHQLGKG